jgi:hypothetical protein
MRAMPKSSISARAPQHCVHEKYVGDAVRFEQMRDEPRAFIFSVIDSLRAGRELRPMSERREIAGELLSRHHSADQFL